jgi:hypothetical protein
MARASNTPENIMPPFDSLKNVKLRLRDHVMPYARRREFLFKGLEEGKVLLAPEDEEYIWAADIDDIDWDGIPKA